MVGSRDSLGWLLASGPASAAKPRTERVAKAACLSGDYIKGVSILAELYVQTNDPNLLFNQGRCYQQSIHCVEAPRVQGVSAQDPKLSDAEKAE